MSSDPYVAEEQPLPRYAKLKNGTVVDADAAVQTYAALRGLGKFQPSSLALLLNLASAGEISDTKKCELETIPAAYIRDGKIVQLVQDLLTVSSPRMSGRMYVFDDPFDQSDPESVRNVELASESEASFMDRVFGGFVSPGSVDRGG